MRRPTTPLASLAVLVAIAMPAPATANRPAKPAEAEAIYATLAAGGLTCASLYPAGICREAIVISTAKRHWAVARIRPEENGENTVRPEDISLHLRGGVWSVHQVGNGGGCHVPRKARRDLHLLCF
jgi:hypothetical protein